MPLIIISLLLLVSPVIYATTSVTERFANYKITGNSVDTLRKQMTTLGPSDISAEHFDASTHWQVLWNYQYEEMTNFCRVTDVKVKVNIIYEFPDWVDYAIADYSLKTRWNTYLLHLRTHERGHAQNGIKAGMNIEQALKALPTMSNCTTLINTADAIAYKMIAEHNTFDINYENETNHGVTQGATFP